MLDKLAIIVKGEQNSGKTTTLKEYSKFYYKPVGSLKKGFRYNVSPFKPKFEAIKIFTYILPSSPTESKIPLENTIEPEEWYPDLILMAEQLNGSEYSNTVHYLMSNEYHIKEFVISNFVGDGIWDRWINGDKNKMIGKLIHRREEIAGYIRKFIKSKAAL